MGYGGGRPEGESADCERETREVGKMPLDPLAVNAAESRESGGEADEDGANTTSSTLTRARVRDT